MTIASLEVLGFEQKFVLLKKRGGRAICVDGTSHMDVVQGDAYR